MISSGLFASKATAARVFICQLSPSKILLKPDCSQEPYSGTRQQPTSLSPRALHAYEEGQGFRIMLVLVTQVDNLRGCWGLAKDSAVALGSFRVTGAPSNRRSAASWGRCTLSFCWSEYAPACSGALRALMPKARRAALSCYPRSWFRRRHRRLNRAKPEIRAAP